MENTHDARMNYRASPEDGAHIPPNRWSNHGFSIILYRYKFFFSWWIKVYTC